MATRAVSNRTGIGQYARQLLQALRPLLEDLWVIGNPPPDSPPGCRAVSLPASISSGYGNKLLAPALLRRYRFSLLHFTTESELYWLRPGATKIVVTIHGCASTTLPPELHEPLPRRALIKYRYLLKRADAIMTVSHASKRDILKIFRVPPEKVTVVANGIAEPFRRFAFEPDQPRRRQGRRPFILSVCATLPKKNLIGLLEALTILKSTGVAHRLIHVGPRDWGYDAVRRQVESLRLQQDVEFKGPASPTELVEYYRAADALVFPSFHEGFGLPILEAMACGCPVITSNCTAMPEVAGDAALFVDPYDSTGIARAILHVLTDEHIRQRLIEKGRRRARQFSWERAARDVMTVYQRVLNRY